VTSAGTVCVVPISTPCPSAPVSYPLCSVSVASQIRPESPGLGGLSWTPEALSLAPSSPSVSLVRSAR
jgi:hypothetical protein